MKQLFLAFALLLSANFARSAPIGAEVQSSNYDAVKGIVTFNVLNTSRKDISAFSLLVRVTHPDGTVGTWEYGGDFLPFMLDVIEEGHPIPPYPGNGALAPGAISSIAVSLGQQQVQAASATVDVVVYTDDTADVRNEQVFQSIISARKGRMLGLQKANELLQNALADPNDAHPSITVAAKLKVLAKQYETNPPAEAKEEGLGLLDAATNISNAPKSPTGRSEKEDSYLRALLVRQQNRIPLILPHTQLAKGVQP
jgi:hypothetical protein